MPCPKCIRDHKYEKELWVHGDECGGMLMIDSEGIVHCTKCRKKAHISKMRISCNCGAHTKAIPTLDELGGALAMGPATEEGALRWFKILLDNLK